VYAVYYFPHFDVSQVMIRCVVLKLWRYFTADCTSCGAAIWRRCVQLYGCHIAANHTNRPYDTPNKSPYPGLSGTV